VKRFVPFVAPSLIESGTLPVLRTRIVKVADFRDVTRAATDCSARSSCLFTAAAGYWQSVQ
jgi:hypothetical protein